MGVNYQYLGAHCNWGKIINFWGHIIDFWGHIINFWGRDYRFMGPCYYWGNIIIFTLIDWGQGFIGGDY